jgi:predicted RNA-binding protein with PIN domain
MKTFLIVDGYNVIHSSNDLKRLSDIQLEEARDKLIQDLSGYAGFKGWETILVFDAYRQESFKSTEEMRGKIKVVYTKKNKTADTYIEKLVFDLPKANTIQVVTSDYTLQRMILANGGERISSRELIEDMAATLEKFREKKKKSVKNQEIMLKDFMDEETLKQFMSMRINNQ